MKTMTIVPGTRLLFLFGAICVPLTLVSVLYPGFGGTGYGIVVLVVLSAAVDALISRNSLKGVSVSFPEVLRLSRGRGAEIHIHMNNSSGKPLRLKLGIVFPVQISSEIYELAVNLSSDTEPSSCVWPVTGLKQGYHLLDRCYLETNSPLKLWLYRTQQKIRCELRVYPDLFSERKNLAAIFMDRGVGIHAKRLVGKGREFEKLREYVPGDSYEDIHWKATAKRGVPISKVFQVERTQDIYLMIDGSRMSARIAGVFHEGHLKDEKRSPDPDAGLFSRETILERYITAALATGMAAEKQGDNFGIGVFSDKVTRFIKAKSGKAHFNACRDMLYTIKPNRVTPDFSEFFTFTGTRIRKRALLIILTSLDDPVLAESFLNNVHMLSRRHLVLVNMLKPAVANPLFTSEDIRSVNDIYQNLGGHMTWNSLRELERSLHRHGTGFFMLGNRQMIPELVSQYIEVKQRQLL